MKIKVLVISLLVFVAMVVGGCDRGYRSLIGDYSYKLSGEVELTDADGTVTYHLVHRNGQMNILRNKSERNKYVITMNEMNGGCYTVNAEMRDGSLILDTHEFSTNILSTSGLPDLDFDQDEDATIVYRVSAVGNGILNGDILIIKEGWTGYQCGNPNARLRGPEMTIMAERN